MKPSNKRKLAVAIRIAYILLVLFAAIYVCADNNNGYGVLLLLLWAATPDPDID